MTNLKRLCLIICILELSGCYGPGPDGKPVTVINLAPSPCKQFDQISNELEITVNKAKKLEAVGKLSAKELFEVSEFVALLQSQSAQACDFFNRGRITFEQYQSEIREIRTSIIELKTKIKRVK